MDDRATARSEGRTPIVPAIDGFRGLAILGIVAIHTLSISGVLAATDGTTFNVLVWGLLGNSIDWFFIISGFVLFLPIARRGGRLGGLRRYAVARGARLLPAYWLVIAICLVLMAIANPLGPGTYPGLGEIVAHLSGLQNPIRMLDPQMPAGFGINGPLWMVSVIIGFYILLPLIAGAYFRRPLLGLLAAAAITLAWKYLIVESATVLTALGGTELPTWILRLIAVEQLPSFAFSFALGMTGAWAYLRVRERGLGQRAERSALWALPLVLALYLGLAYVYGQDAAEVNSAIAGSAARTDPLLGLASSLTRAALMAAIVLAPLWVQRPFITPSLIWFAGLSYGIYLIHMPILIYADRYLGLPVDGAPGTFLLWMALVLAASLAYSALSRKWVEVPVRDWARRFERSPADRRPAPASPPSPAPERSGDRKLAPRS